MNVKVIKRFKDKYTSIFHEIDDIIEVDEKRFAELDGFVEKIQNSTKSNTANDSEKTESKKKTEK